MTPVKKSGLQNSISRFEDQVTYEEGTSYEVAPH